MLEPSSGWGREFDEPIALPDGAKLIVLRDAASYITALPDEEADAPEWQAAIEALMLVAELGGPTMFARIGVMRALNRGHVREFDPSQERASLGAEKAEERSAMTVLIYVDTSKQVGDQDHLKVFANAGRRGNLVRGKRPGRRGVRI